MSVIPLKADIHQRGLHVRLVPIADILLLSLDLFEVTRPPALVERGLFRTIDAEVGKGFPFQARLDPTLFTPGRPTQHNEYHDTEHELTRLDERNNFTPQRSLRGQPLC